MQDLECPRDFRSAKSGRTVYEWEQSMEEVNLYIETPPGVKADGVDCKITPTHIRLGLKGNPPFIDVRLPTDRCTF